MHRVLHLAVLGCAVIFGYKNYVVLPDNARVSFPCEEGGTDFEEPICQPYICMAGKVT